VSKWQPIETAPKDGSWFLTWTPPSEHSSAMYPNIDMAQHDGKGWCKISCGFSRVTHWMPLPEPPAKAMEASGQDPQGLDAKHESASHKGLPKSTEI